MEESLSSNVLSNIQRAAELRTRHRACAPTELKKNTSELVIQKLSKAGTKIDATWGVWSIILGVGGSILVPFWASGRFLAPKCVLGGVLGGSRVILRAKMVPT